MNRLRIFFLTFGILALKSVNENLTQEEKEQLKQSWSGILRVFLCIFLTITTGVLLFS